MAKKTLPKRLDALVICYWSLTDPLCQTQCLAYVRQIAASGRRFALITFEQDRFRLSTDGAAAMRRSLAAWGILWYPLTYHKRYPLLATGFDCLCGVLLGVFICIRYRVKIVHSRASVPAAMALVIRALTRVRFLYDADSRLSEEYADNGHWRRNGLAFRAMAWVEAAARNRAHAIVVLSHRLRNDFIKQFGVRAPITVIPCCVDTDRFQFRPDDRDRKRRELGIGDERLFVYVGKVGARYLVSEMFAFYAAARQAWGNVRLLILSGDPADRFAEIAAAQKIVPSDYTLIRADYRDVPAWLCAADAGIALIRPAGCERGSSPIKIAEYLACGLPVVMTDEIGDASDLVRQNGVGVVLETLDLKTMQHGLHSLFALWTEDNRLRDHCRAVACKSMSLVPIAADRFESVYSTLLTNSPYPSSSTILSTPIESTS